MIIMKKILKIGQKRALLVFCIFNFIRIMTVIKEFPIINALRLLI